MTHRAGSRTIVTRSLDTPEMQHDQHQHQHQYRSATHDNDAEQPAHRAREHLHHERVYTTPRELDLLPP